MSLERWERMRGELERGIAEAGTESAWYAFIEPEDVRSALDAAEDTQQLARDVLSLAEDADMPFRSQAVDKRLERARRILVVLSSD